MYKLSGKRSRPWVAYKDGIVIGYAETRSAAEALLAPLVGRKLTPVYDMTFKEVYEAWKPTHFPDVGYSAQRRYESSFAISEELHDRKFRDLRTQDFQRVLDARAETAAQQTVAADKHLFTQLSQWAMKNEIVGTDYASFCKVRGRAARHHEPLTEDEIRRIQSDISETARIVCMLLATGCRISELFLLPLEDYHGDYFVGGSKSDAGRNRVIPIRPEGRPHFEYFAAKARERGGHLLIDGYDGSKRPENFRTQDYYPLLDRLGIDRSKTPHSTRTTYATRAVKEGLDPAVTQKVLGHADFGTTQKFYNQPDADTLVEAVEAAASARSKTS